MVRYAMALAVFVAACIPDESKTAPHDMCGECTDELFACYEGARHKPIEALAVCQRAHDACCNNR
jgi:hypothetical protein